jgi:xanthine dehydrogenase small subunit
MISFMLNDQAEHISDLPPDTTLLNYLRENKKLTGSKEGCASGDCGACTVVVAEKNSDNSALEYRAINSCVTFLSALEGKQLITVEHLADENQLHPVQQALVEFHASQCGFCTPGFVMSLFALYHQSGTPNREDVQQALSGNLCRCTGYRPIIDASINVCHNKSADKFDLAEEATLASLNVLSNGEKGISGLHIPQSRQALAQLKKQHPDAQLFAGSTDLALEVTQQLKTFNQLISVRDIPELNELDEEENGIRIGAAVSLNKLDHLLLTHFPFLDELHWRFASMPIRNQATMGGNIANASPIGDLPPVLLALSATITVDNGHAKREIPIDKFFTGYRQTNLNSDEWVESIYIPYISESCQAKAYKVSKRIEDDISAVCAVYNLVLDEQHNILHIDSGFGGIAATPVKAGNLKQLIGKNWTKKSTYQQGAEILSQSFNPIDDVRASASYRQQMVTNLWQRFWLETNPATAAIQTRVISHA